MLTCMTLVHTDHCAKKLLPWLDGMLDEDEKFFKANGVPLFSSHMIDLSGKCLRRMRPLPPMRQLTDLQ